jgi:hypothetical protein
VWGSTPAVTGIITITGIIVIMVAGDREGTGHGPITGGVEATTGRGKSTMQVAIFTVTAGSGRGLQTPGM